MPSLWRVKKKEQVTTSGPFARPQLDKKKKKRGHLKASEFYFIVIPDDWKSLLTEADFVAFTKSSSFVGNVRYNNDNQSMLILLNEKAYNFCNVSRRTYDSFEGSGSKGAFFNRSIKGQFDC